MAQRSAAVHSQPAARTLPAALDAHQSCHGKIEVFLIASRSDWVRCGAFAVSEAVSAIAKFRRCLEAKASFMLDALPND
jgi:hypothetical protein